MGYTRWVPTSDLKHIRTVSEGMNALLVTCAALLPLWLAAAPAHADGLQEVGMEPGYSLEVDKSDRTLIVRKGKAIARKFQIAVGRGGLGDKRIRGDNKTPLGVYRITEFKDDSGFDLFMRINYPNLKDGFYGLRNHLIDRRQFDQIVAAARNNEMPPQDTSIGGAVGIHGLGEETEERVKVQQLLDWTRGCIAMRNKDVHALRQYVQVGTKVTIRE